MNVIAENSNASWSLPVKKREGVIVEVLHHIHDKPAEKIPVPVFSARLRYDGHFRKNTHSLRHLFTDEQTGMVYRFSPKTVELLLKAILAGEVVPEDHSVFVGDFTFKLYGEWIFAAPLSGLEKAKLGL